MRLDLVQDLKSVPDHCHVIRLARLPKDFLEKKKVLPVQLDKELEPSTQDKDSKPPHLSFWVEFLTTPNQAYNFLRENNPNSDKKLVLRLKVEEIRKVVGIVDKENTYPELLDVTASTAVMRYSNSN